MKKIALFLLGLLVMTSASADENEYVPLVREGVVWEYVGVVPCPATILVSIIIR